MNRRIRAVLFSLVLTCALSIPAHAATHTVAPGDTLWHIAVTYQVGTSELIAANPQLRDPNRIYPGDVLTIPTLSASVRASEREVVHLVNAERAKYGLAALSEDWELSRVARYKAQDMRDRHYFDHTSPTYGSPFDMIRAFGLHYRSAGENIAYGYRTPEAVVQAWMTSSGHRANILNASYTRIGVGYVASGNYWVQHFIG